MRISSCVTQTFAQRIPPILSGFLQHILFLSIIRFVIPAGFIAVGKGVFTEIVLQLLMSVVAENEYIRIL